MSAFKSIQILSKDIKSEMKSLGIKVLRCAQNNSGVLITIDSNIDNQQKAVDYLNSNNMSISSSLKPTIKACSGLGYIDFGTVYKWVKI